MIKNRIACFISNVLNIFRSALCVLVVIAGCSLIFLAYMCHKIFMNLDDDKTGKLYWPTFRVLWIIVSIIFQSFCQNFRPHTTRPIFPSTYSISTALQTSNKSIVNNKPKYVDLQVHRNSQMLIHEMEFVICFYRFLICWINLQIKMEIK